MPNLRTIVTATIPVLTVFIGLLWFFSKKKTENGTSPDSKTNQRSQNVAKTKNGSASGTEAKPGSSTGASDWSPLEKKQVKGILKTSSKPDVAGSLISMPVGSLNSLYTDCNEQEPFVDVASAHNLPERVKRSVVISDQINASNNSFGSEEVGKAEDEKEDIDSDSFITASETSLSGRSPVQSSPKSEESDHVNPLLEQHFVSHEPYQSNVNNNAEVISTIFNHDCKVENNFNQFPDSGCDQNEENKKEVNKHQSNVQTVHVELPSEMNHCESDTSVKVTKNGPKMTVKHLDGMHSQKNENDPVKNGSQNILNDLMQKESTEIKSNKHKPTENNRNHLDSSNCDNLSEVSNDSGKGGSVDNAQPLLNDEERLFEFNIPSDMCGLFIGTRGKTIKMICKESGTQIRLNNNPYTRDFQICVIEGTQGAIDRACGIIKKKFPSLQVTGTNIRSSSHNATMIMPDIAQLSLPEGVTVDVLVSSIVDAGRIFVQQPTHPTFPSLEKLRMFMNQCYMQDGHVPDIPRPIELGVICAAPMLGGWYRAQIMATHEATDESDIKYVDYGGYTRISSTCLKQIRIDFMTLPFEAVECYLANITPLPSEPYFSAEAAVVLEELTHGKLLHAQIVGRAEDSIPYVHLYQRHASNAVVFVNREMVNRGVVRWLEVMT